MVALSGHYLSNERNNVLLNNWSMPGSKVWDLKPIALSISMMYSILRSVLKLHCNKQEKEIYTKLKEPSLTQYNFQIADKVSIHVSNCFIWLCSLRHLASDSAWHRKSSSQIYARCWDLEWKYFVLILSYLSMNSLKHMAPKIVWHSTECNFVSEHLLRPDLTLLQIDFQYLQRYATILRK